MSCRAGNPLRAFEPDQSTFDLEWIDSWDQDGIRLKSFRLTTAHLSDGEVRTYGVVAFPAGAGPFPGILHIHGGGQTASPENAVHFARLGFVTLSFDWTGLTPEREPATVTTYPAGYVAGATPLQQLDEQGLERNRLFLAVKASRCCLTLLGSLDGVDPERIGIYGISWGGFLTWLVNGVDPRAKCAVPVYGTGGLHWPGHIWNHQWAGISEAARAAWIRFLEPRSYALTQASPVLHIDGTNDFFGGVDVMAELLPMVLPECRVDLSPNANHHFESGGARLVEQWFAHYLQGGEDIPASPTLRVLQATPEQVKVEASGAPEALELWYSCGPLPHKSRCWQRARSWERVGPETLVMELPVRGETWLFVRERWPQRGVTLCSFPVCIDAPDSTPTNPARAAEAIYSGDSIDGLGSAGSTEILGANTLADLCDATDGLAAKQAGGDLLPVVMRLPAAPAGRPPPGAGAVSASVSGAASLQIDCLCGDGVLTEVYTRRLAYPEDGEVTVGRAEFRGADGSVLPDMAQIRAFVLSGASRANELLRIREITWR